MEETQDCSSEGSVEEETGESSSGFVLQHCCDPHYLLPLESSDIKDQDDGSQSDEDKDNYSGRIVYDTVDHEGKIICQACKSQINGSSYGCSKCRFYLHRDCGTKYPAFIAHFTHGGHYLELIRPKYHFPSSLLCGFCNHPLLGHGLIYRCEERCDAYLHCHCALVEPSHHHPLHPHPFFYRKRNVRSGASCFVCNAEFVRGVELEPLYDCSACQVVIHKACFQSDIPSQIHTADHSHPLLLTTSDEHEDDEACCDLCKSTITDRPLYQCKDCNYIRHVRCPDEQARSGYRIVEDLGQGGAPVKIQHWSHYLHPLVESEKGGDTTCSACLSALEGPAFGCDECSFFLHDYCAKMSRELWHPTHPEAPLRLAFSVDADKHKEFYGCRLCWVEFHDERFIYQCYLGCNLCYQIGRFWIHADCAMLTPYRKKPFDKHPFVLITKVGVSDMKCSACGLEFGGGEEGTSLYRCLECGFMLHRDCFEFPSVVMRDHHHHPLTLYLDPDPEIYDEKPYYCDACDNIRDVHAASYACKDCDYVCHVRCKPFRNTKDTNAPKSREVVVANKKAELETSERNIRRCEEKLKRLHEQLRSEMTRKSSFMEEFNNFMKKKGRWL